MMRKLIVIATLAGALGGAPAAIAADGDGANRAVIEEVVVTATRRETSQQSTALSVTTITPEQIEKRFMTDIRGVADLSPNVVMENVTGFNAAAFAIRGTGTNDIITTIDTAVAVNTAFYTQLNHFLLTICTHQVKGAQQCQVKEITF